VGGGAQAWEPYISLRLWLEPPLSVCKQSITAYSNCPRAVNFATDVVMYLLQRFYRHSATGTTTLTKTR